MDLERRRWYPEEGVDVDMNHVRALLLWTTLMVDESFSDSRVYLHNIGPFNHNNDLCSIMASWYGSYGWPTCVIIPEEAFEEALASRSRGTTVQEGMVSSQWILISISVTPEKAFQHCMLARTMSPAVERNSIKSWRIMGNVNLGVELQCTGTALIP